MFIYLYLFYNVYLFNTLFSFFYYNSNYFIIMQFFN